MAYESLVEQPTRHITSLVQMRQTSVDAAINSSDCKQPTSLSDTHMLLKLPVHRNGNRVMHHHDDYANAEMSVINKKLEPLNGIKDDNLEQMNPVINAIPLPPRDKNKPQNSMKRHTREHPLVIKDELLQSMVESDDNQNNFEPSIENSSDLHTNTATNSNETITNSDRNCFINNHSNYTNQTQLFQHNSNIGQYQNIINCEDSFDTPSLKFEAQLENNFDSTDCCDGTTCDFDCETKSSNSNSNIDTEHLLTIDQNTNNQYDCQEHNSNGGVVSSLINISSKLVDYVDSGAVALNPFEQKIEEPKSSNPFSQGAVHKRVILPPPKQVPNELASNVLFNKIKTGLQEPQIVSNSFSNRSHSDHDDNKAESGDESLMVGSVKSLSDWRGQRRTVSENLDDVEPNMCMKGSPDRVSVEDLLEFSQQKSCGRQRGTESDEVRIMCKVLNQQVSKETCLKILDFASWDVHRAIKLAKLQCFGIEGPTLYECEAALDDCCGDGAKAAALLAAHCDISDIALV